MKAKYESIQRSRRQMLGEDLEQLSVKELQQIERQLESSLTQTRRKMMQRLVDQMEELKQKEHQLEDINKQLKNKIDMENSSFQVAEGPWRSDAITEDNLLYLLPPQSNNMDEEHTMQIGYQYHDPNEATTSRYNEDANNYMQNWAP